MLTELRGPEIVGTFACPDGDGPFTAVLGLGGSDGGIPAFWVDMLVPEGFAVLALAYHQGLMGAELGDLVPVDMYDLPLERVEQGLRWLIAQPQALAHDGRVGVVGASKGGELALLAAATFPDLVGPVVGYTPSSVVWQGFSWSSPGTGKTSTWSHHGEPSPFVPIRMDVPPVMSEQGMSFAPIYDRSLDNAEAAERAGIAVERATGPILLVSGDADGMWPAERMCREVVDRMTRFGRADDVRHLNYVGAGHMLMGLEVPPEVAALDLGGTPEADKAADADARPQVVAHLRSI